MNTPELERFFQNKINTAITEGLFPGGGIGYSVRGETPLFVYSRTRIPGTALPYSDSTRFDIASLTKSIVAMVANKLIDSGKIKLTTKIYRKMPILNSGWKNITVQHLLTNSLELEISQKLDALNPDLVKKIILNAAVTHLGDNYYYHNSTSIILGWYLENLLNLDLEEIIKEYVLKPAGMTSTCFYSSIPKNQMPHVPPSEQCDLRGIVHGMPHDETAYIHAMHGLKIACAGIFSTVPDMVAFGNHVVNYGYKNKASAKTLKLIMTNYLAHCGRTFGLGFDFPDPTYLCPCFARSTLVMTGFTGCNIFIQPKYGKIFVMLSNATFPTRGPRGQKSPLGPLRKELAAQAFYCKHCME
jgi:CubicO group peptidase (beta-lactamase class C family)